MKNVSLVKGLVLINALVSGNFCVAGNNYEEQIAKIKAEVKAERALHGFQQRESFERMNELARQQAVERCAEEMLASVCYKDPLAKQQTAEQRAKEILESVVYHEDPEAEALFQESVRLLNTPSPRIEYTPLPPLQINIDMDAILAQIFHPEAPSCPSEASTTPPDFANRH
ncbi:MAG: hypothetical protein LBQ43_03315 [Holosporales bacterium]|jgi:hypothetical protein|nr:hypothetical protein [Holosporales bacterium]